MQKTSYEVLISDWSSDVCSSDLGTLADYDAVRIAAGVPDGSRDLAVEKATLLESGFDALQGLDWDKGCYMGQELPARMRYRGWVKKRLIPVETARPTPAAGTAVKLGTATWRASCGE